MEHKLIEENKMNQDKLNILITAPSLDTDKNVSGISTVVSNIIKYNIYNNFFHYQVGSSDYSKKSLKWALSMIATFLKFPFFILKNKINIVHLNIPFDAKGISREFFLFSIARLLRIGIVAHLHGGEFLMTGIKNTFIRKLAKTMLFKSDKVIVLSNLESDSLVRNFKYSGAEILHNCIDTMGIKYSPSFPNKEIIQILFLGRIHESKGVLDIVESLRLLQNNNNFRFVVCGAGPLKDLFVEECHLLLKNKFEFKGVVSGFEKEAILEKSDIFILPSRWGEGLPMALLETMAFGVVPIVSDDASITQVVKHLKNGLIVKKNNPKDLALKIESLIKDTNLLAKLSKEAHNTISSNYDISQYNNKLCDIYRKTIQ